MKIVFALIWITYSNAGGGPVKIGEYEKYSQCIEQGHALESHRGDDFLNDNFKCVPVNATGSR